MVLQKLRTKTCVTRPSGRYQGKARPRDIKEPALDSHGLTQISDQVGSQELLAQVPLTCDVITTKPNDTIQDQKTDGDPEMSAIEKGLVTFGAQGDETNRRVARQHDQHGTNLCTQGA